MNGSRRCPNELLSESLRQQLADLIFTAPFQDETQDEVTIFILVEHQPTPSPMMRFRVLFYMVQLWDLQRRQAERDPVPERRTASAALPGRTGPVGRGVDPRRIPG